MAKPRAASLVPVLPEPNGEFARLVRDADRVVVSTFGFEKRLLMEEETSEGVRTIAGLFRYTGEYAGAFYYTKPDGEEVVATVKCACDGNYLFTFHHGDREIFRVTVHHWSHTRAPGLAGGSDLTLSAESVRDLKELVAKSSAWEAKQIAWHDEQLARQLQEAAKKEAAAANSQAEREARQP